MYRFASILAICVLAILPPARAADDAARAPVDRLYETLLATMKDGKQLGFEGRRAKLQPVLKEAYNFPAMMKTIAGRYWDGMSEADRTRLTDAFAEMSSATYASRFDSFDNERFEVLGQEPGPREAVWVKSQLVPSGGGPVSLNYLMRKDDGGKWRITDVFVDGTVSEIATRRSEYGSVLGRAGVSGLIDELEKKAKDAGKS